MHAANFNLNDYFQRIGYSDTPATNLQTLSELMLRQLCAIPFENLDVLAGKAISLEPEALVDKLIYQPRGGYCYELNGLFAIVLQALAIPYRFLAARPLFLPVMRPKTHMALLVEVDGTEWLCDLGYGSFGMRAPLRLDHLDVPVEQDNERFLLTRDERGDYIFKAWVNEGWQSQYGFDLSYQEWIDFSPGNYLNYNHPQSLFRQKPVLVRFTPEGRNILFGDALKILRHKRLEQRNITPEDYPGVLRSEFGLELPA